MATKMGAITLSNQKILGPVSYTIYHYTIYHFSTVRTIVYEKSKFSKVVAPTPHLLETWCFWRKNATTFRMYSAILKVVVIEFQNYEKAHRGTLKMPFHFQIALFVAYRGPAFSFQTLLSNWNVKKTDNENIKLMAFFTAD